MTTDTSNITKKNPIVKQQIIRVGIYERVSSQEQAQHGVSLDEQSERLELLAKLEGWQVYDHYRDEGITGGTDNRPHLQRLLADARAGRIDLVVCTKLDRLFRNTRLLLNYIHELEGYGVGFVAQAEGIDTRNPGIGKIMLTLLGSIAEWERERIGQRISDFRQHLASKGQWSSGRTPFGYRFDKKQKVLEIEESEARGVRFAFDTYTRQPMGIIRLAEAMNIEALITPRMGRRQHNTWTQSAVRHILTHPAYRGGPNENWRFNTPMIVEPETWERAQHRLSENRHFNPATRGVTQFQGKLRCGFCSHTLRVGYSHNTTAVYECPGRLKRLHLDGSARCTLPRFEVSSIDSTLSRQLADLYSSPDNFRKYITDTLINLDRERQELEARLKPLDAESGRIREDMAIVEARLEMHRIAPEVYKTRMAKLQRSLRELEARKDKADPCLVREMTTNKKAAAFYRVVLWSWHGIDRSIDEIGTDLEFLQTQKETNNYLKQIDDHLADGPKQLLSTMSGIVFPEHIELKANIEVGQSNVTPGYRSTRYRQSR